MKKGIQLYWSGISLLPATSHKSQLQQLTSRAQGGALTYIIHSSDVLSTPLLTHQSKAERNPLTTSPSSGQGMAGASVTAQTYPTLLQHEPQKRAPLPSNGMFSSLCHMLPQVLNVFEILKSRVRDQEGWRGSHRTCIDRPWFATPQRREGNSTWAGTHIRRDSHLLHRAPRPHHPPWAAEHQPYDTTAFRGVQGLWQSLTWDM